jgi:hypothetical protein
MALYRFNDCHSFFQNNIFMMHEACTDSFVTNVYKEKHVHNGIYIISYQFFTPYIPNFTFYNFA